MLLDIMRDDNALALRVSLATGLRIGDVLSLRPQDVHADGGISCTCQKTGKPFTASVSARMVRALSGNANYLWVFPSPRKPTEHKTRQAVWADIKRAVRLCGLTKNITPHSARKIFAVGEFRRNGLEAVQNELQHDRISTTMIYAFSDLLGGKRRQFASERGTNEGDSPEFVEKFVESLVENLGGAEALRKALWASLTETFPDAQRAAQAE